MANILELIKRSAVPDGVMRTAARGELSIPPAEMLEILVYLADHSSLAGEAQSTLANWNEVTCKEVLADPATPREVLNYFISSANHRTTLLATLFENPSVSEGALAGVAETAQRTTLDVLLHSQRVRRSPEVLRAVRRNPCLTPQEAATIRAELVQLGAEQDEDEDHVLELGVEQWVRDHSKEIAAEEGSPFALIGGIEDDPEAAPEATAITQQALAAATAVAKEPERLTTLQRLARLTVGERVQVAMKGAKEERSILIRDGSKVVSSAVLASPKLSEAEVENFASLKNVQESVLRGIARNRKFIKNYPVNKNLCNNPRTPLDLSLSLMKSLTPVDLKSLSQNKNVPDTLRKMAARLHKTRLETPGGGS